MHQLQPAQLQLLEAAAGGVTARFERCQLSKFDNLEIDVAIAHVRKGQASWVPLYTLRCIF